MANQKGSLDEGLPAVAAPCSREFVTSASYTESTSEICPFVSSVLVSELKHLLSLSEHRHI